MELFGAQRLDAPPVTAPAYVPAALPAGDSLGPLILRSGFTSSYAPAEPFGAAHRAATTLAQNGRTVSIVQLGTFADGTNAERVATRFKAFGRVETSNVASAGRTLYTVRVLVGDPDITPQNVVAAAADLGLSDAFIVSR